MENRIEALESAVLASLGRHVPYSALIASVSGGADSTALLVASARLRGELGYSLRCLHVDHGIREEHERSLDEAHVRELCGRFDVPLRIVRIPPGRITAEAARTGAGIEAVARSFRLAAWAEDRGSDPGARVLVGHTADDALETALMRFLRGCGPAGLAAMPEAGGPLIRPLLGLGRSDILAYLGALRITYRVDSTNADTAYLRNRVRSRLIPLLDREFPFWRTGAANAAMTQRKVASFLDDENKRRIRWRRSERTPSAVETDAENFKAQPPILREEAIFRALHLALEGAAAEGGRLRADEPRSARREPSRRPVARFAAGDIASADLGAARALAVDKRVVVEALGGEGAEAAFSILIDAPGTYESGPLRLLVSDSPVPGMAAAIGLPFVFRSALPEDRVLTRDGARRASRLGPPGMRAVLEDGAGIAACLVAPACGPTECFPRADLVRSLDYARSAFFSIL
ncbi:MAG: tRNA lysidine(34) synthetase TilS [Treponema sp. GWB1_62_6]|nr:MAG: tRNA lysidine(34) synthetase TilS [Treponema sp. GWC1_61_84]OHE70742.1 MAG: tRNA lysidine(34) synthetase TilS [Treponema sp. GWB1_62_6]HCM26263.1 tRNA lysidine(34) synthetase TilS [Treponema sp.]